MRWRASDETGLSAGTFPERLPYCLAEVLEPEPEGAASPATGRRDEYCVPLALKRRRAAMIDPGTAQRSPNAGRSPEKLRLRHLAARANPRSGHFGLAWRSGTKQGRLRKPASGEISDNLRLSVRSR